MYIKEISISKKIGLFLILIILSVSAFAQVNNVELTVSITLNDGYEYSVGSITIPADSHGDEVADAVLSFIPTNEDIEIISISDETFNGSLRIIKYCKKHGANGGICNGCIGDWLEEQWDKIKDWWTKR